MARLKSKHKEYIVKRLACFDSPSQVIEKVKEVWGLELPASQVTYYNPENKQGRELAPKWRHLFFDTRKKFIESASKIPIAHKSYRLKQLDKIHTKAMEIGNTVEARAALEQAAKEVGGAYESMKDFDSETGTQVNFYTQIKNKIIQMNNNA